MYDSVISNAWRTLSVPSSKTGKRDGARERMSADGGDGVWIRIADHSSRASSSKYTMVS